MKCPECGSEDLISAKPAWWMRLVPGSACYRCDDCDHLLVSRERHAPHDIEDDEGDEEELDVNEEIEPAEQVEVTEDPQEPDVVAESEIVAEELVAAADELIPENDRTEDEGIAPLFEERIREAQDMVKRMRKSGQPPPPEAKDV